MLNIPLDVLLALYRNLDKVYDSLSSEDRAVLDKWLDGGDPAEAERLFLTIALG